MPDIIANSTADIFLDFTDLGVDVSDYTNLTLEIGLDEGYEYSRTATAIDSATLQPFTQDIRVIVGDTSLSEDVYYMPALLATSVQSVTAYRDRGNKHCIRITHDGEAVDLTAFSRFELFGLNTGGIDSAVNPGAFDATTGNGKLVLDVGSLITVNSPAKTTLIGYSSSEPEGVVLWDKSIASSRVTFNIH